MQKIVDSIIQVVPVIVLLLPIVVNLFSLIAQKSHNQKLINLSERSKIIVQALDQSGLTNEEKKQRGVKKLAEYANQVGIKMTPDQLDDYIEASVKVIRNLSK
jgi:Phage holin protein (Holin_LLH).